jgi:hypothetical protein
MKEMESGWMSEIKRMSEARTVVSVYRVGRRLLVWWLDPFVGWNGMSE